MPPTMSSPPDSPRAVMLILPAAAPAGEKAPKAGRKRPAALVPVRVWSEADEVRILEVLAAYAAKHGAPPERSQLRAALLGRGLDKAEFSLSEIYEKVRRLRNKYCTLRAAGGPPEHDGADERRKYELSASIWGDLPANVVKKQGGARADAGQPKADGVRRGFEELQGLYPFLAVEVGKITDDEVLAPVLKRAFEFIDDEEAGRLEAKLKKQIVQETQLATKGTALRGEVLVALIGFSG